MPKKNKSRLLGTIVAAVALGAFVASGSAWAGGSTTKLKTDLDGGGAIASGSAKWEKRGASTENCSGSPAAKRCKFSVQGEDFDPNESVEITTTNCEAATHTVTADAFGGFDLNLDTNLGNTVPDCVAGSTVTATGASSGAIIGNLQPD